MEKIGKQKNIHYCIFKCSFAMGAFAPTNRRLLNKKVLLQWEKPWGLLAERNESSEWLALLDAARTYFKKKALY